MSNRFPSRRLLIGTLMPLLFAPAFAVAQSFATKPIRIVIPFAPGGSTDILARALGEGLGKELGQPIIVESKPGAGSVLGNDAVAKSAPDGHTLLLTTSSFAVVPSLHPKLPYGQESGFAPVTILGRAPNVFFVRADSPIRSASDFLARARAQPGRMTYGSSGNGSSTHLSAELLKISAKIFVTHIPYRGASAVVTDALGGQIDVGVATLPSVLPMINSGKVRALAVSGRTRSPVLPNVPTVAEAGVAGYEADNWYGIFAAGGTSPAVVKQLYDAIQKTAAVPAFRQRAAAEGLVVSLETPQATAAFVRAEEAKWRRVVKEQSITSD